MQCSTAHTRLYMEIYKFGGISLLQYLFLFTFQKYYFSQTIEISFKCVRMQYELGAVAILIYEHNEQDIKHYKINEYFIGQTIDFDLLNCLQKKEKL